MDDPLMLQRLARGDALLGVGLHHTAQQIEQRGRQRRGRRGWQFTALDGGEGHLNLAKLDADVAEDDDTEELPAYTQVVEGAQLAAVPGESAASSPSTVPEPHQTLVQPLSLQPVSPKQGKGRK